METQNKGQNNDYSLDPETRGELDKAEEKDSSGLYVHHSEKGREVK